MRKTLLVATTAAALTFALAAPATADTTGGTVATFELTAGLLSVTVPATANLGSNLTGVAAASGSLGSVGVADGRGGVAAWTATVASGIFTSAQNIGLDIVAATVGYAPGAATSTTGSAIFTPGVAGVIGASKAAFLATSVSGNNTAAWAPTLSVPVPATAKIGTYSGTITHSVA